MSFPIRLSLAFAVVTTACVRARGTEEGRIAASALTTRAADSVVAEPTGSPALDRITKRTPALDGIVRHSGSGRGTIIYVFDGGIAAAHSELAGRVRAGFDAFPGTARICNAHGTAVAGAAAGATISPRSPTGHSSWTPRVSCRRSTARSRCSRTRAFS